MTVGVLDPTEHLLPNHPKRTNASTYVTGSRSLEVPYLAAPPGGGGLGGNFVHSCIIDIDRHTSNTLDSMETSTFDGRKLGIR